MGQGPPEGRQAFHEYKDSLFRCSHWLLSECSSLHCTKFPSCPTQPHTSPSFTKYPSTWFLGDMVSSLLTLRSLSLEQAQVAKCPSLKPKFSPKPTFQGQRHHHRPWLSTSIPGTSGCVLRAGATSQLQGSPHPAAPRAPSSKGNGCCLLGWSSWASNTGI